MADYTYLMSVVPKYIDSNAQRNYAFAYNAIRLKRFFALNIMAFSFQYLCIYHLQSPYPILPLYPAIGIAFTVIAILGENAILGLLLGGVCAYALKGFSASYTFLYSLADIACAYLGAFLCRNVFSSDIPSHATSKIWTRFILISAFVTLLSAALRIAAIVMSEKVLPEYLSLFYIYLDLWLADLNAIVLFYAFLSSWLSIYMSREKVSSGKIPLLQIILFVLFVAASVLLMKKVAVIYLLSVGMLLTIYFAFLHGIVVASLLMYVMSMLYLSYFMAHQVYYLTWLGIAGYTLVPGVLFVFILASILPRRFPRLRE